MLKHTEREVNNSHFADVFHYSLRFVPFEIETTKEEGS